MTGLRRLMIALLGAASGFMFAPRVQAQDAGIMSREALEEMMDERASAVSGARAALDAFLGRGEVARAAEGAGIDIERVKSAASALSDEEVESLAPRVKDIQEALVGGDTFVISSTAVIIGLLVIILIIVA
jgi:hypothetical protein